MPTTTTTPDVNTTDQPYTAYADGLIQNAGLIGTTSESFVADIDFGAQLGYGPNLPNIDGATPLVMAPLVVIVTHIPTMFANVNNAAKTLKALVERHAKEVSGVDFGYQLEGSPTPVGQDGQEMHMPTNAKRTPVTPTFTWQELQGNLVWNFHKNWIEMIKSPDTQASMLSSLNLGTTMSPMLMSSFTMDILCIQFDPTMRPENIIDAWFVTNMWPQETGLIGAKRQIGHSETPERQIAYYGVLQHNRNTKAVGQIIATALGLHKANYDFAMPMEDTVDDNIVNMGLQSEATIQNTAFVAIDPTTSSAMM
jgi:hypothetical protein